MADKPSEPRGDVSSPPTEDIRSSVGKQGTLKWFNTTKGFGFIVPEESEGGFVIAKGKTEAISQQYDFVSLGDFGAEIKLVADPSDQASEKGTDIPDTQDALIELVGRYQREALGSADGHLQELRARMAGNH